MKTITIKEIVKKDSGLVIVKDIENQQATLNTKWQSQEVDYLEKDVGIGGKVNVEITVKGNYTNITKVDFNSAVKGATKFDMKNVEINPSLNNGKYQLMTQKDISIVSQCMVKCVAMSQGKMCLGEAIDMYHEAVLSFEQNG